MANLNWKHELLHKGHRLFFSGQPYAMHCHHYNINLQKTIEETLGDVGIHLIFGSAEESSYRVFRNLIDKHSQFETIKSKLEMAATMYQNFGMGVIAFQHIDADGGRVVSLSGHHVTGWLAKHGRRDTPGCHFTRGWIAGVLAVMYEKPLAFYRVTETQCKMAGGSECIFEVSPAPTMKRGQRR